MYKLKIKSKTAIVISIIFSEINEIISFISEDLKHVEYLLKDYTLEISKLPILSQI